MCVYMYVCCMCMCVHVCMCMCVCVCIPKEEKGNEHRINKNKQTNKQQANIPKLNIHNYFKYK